MRKVVLMFMLLLSACSCSHITPVSAAPQQPTPALSPALVQLLEQVESSEANAPLNFDIESKSLGSTNFEPVVHLDGRVDSDLEAHVQATIKKATEKKVDGLIVVINSPGGEVDSGESISRQLASAPFPVHCVVDGEADSMGFYILQGCTDRHMALGSRLMAHEPIYTVNGVMGVTQIEALRERLGVLKHSMAEFESRRMKLTVAEFEKQIAGRDWWMTCDTAMQVGAVDSVVSSVADYVRAQR